MGAQERRLGGFAQLLAGAVRRADDITNQDVDGAGRRPANRTEKH